MVRIILALHALYVRLGRCRSRRRSLLLFLENLLHGVRGGLFASWQRREHLLAPLPHERDRGSVARVWERLLGILMALLLFRDGQRRVEARASEMDLLVDRLGVQG